MSTTPGSSTGPAAPRHDAQGTERPFARAGKAPGRLPTAWKRLRQNLFNTWYNGVLTAAVTCLLYLGLRPVLRWTIFEARWDVIPANFQPLLIGTYPRSQVWRIWAIALPLALLAGVTAGAFRASKRRASIGAVIAAAVLWLFPVSLFSRAMIILGAALFSGGLAAAWGRPPRRRWLALGWALLFPWALLMLWGVQGSRLLPRIETSGWGGLVLTLVLAVAGITFSLPIGVLLALGRRSGLPAVSWCCAAFIEVVRGTPLVAVVFMAHLLVPMFLPEFRIDKVVRAMIGFTIFTSAYMAENVRGGLQSVPKGQYESALALGMNSTLVMLLVILPQALRAVIPSIIGQFISLLKDTSLVAIIGLLDLLGVARSVLANPAWLAMQAEVYLFVAFVYWSLSFTLSRSSRRLEEALDAGRKR